MKTMSDTLYRVRAIGWGLLLACSVTLAQDDFGECAAPGAGIEQPMYSFDGIEYFEEDLPANIQQALYDLRLALYQKQLELIDAAMLTQHLQALAEQTGRTEQSLAEELFAVGRPDAAAVEAFYEANRDRISYPLDAVRDQIRQMLAEQAAQERRQQVLTSLKQISPFVVGLRAPIAPFVDIDIEGAPRKGPAGAPVVIVEFADYQCPHCKHAGEALSALMQAYPEQVQVVFKDFPVNRSGISRVVARGAFCADRQQQFWPYHDLAFENQDMLAHSSPTAIATQLGLDVEAFKGCLAGTESEQWVARSQREGERLGVGSTPTLFLNGRRLNLRDLDADLRKAVEIALAEKAS